MLWLGVVHQRNEGLNYCKTHTAKEIKLDMDIVRPLVSQLLAGRKGQIVVEE